MSSKATENESAAKVANDELQKWSQVQHTVQLKIKSLTAMFAGLTGREVFTKLGLPYSYSVGTKLDGKALVAIRQCLKRGGYPGASDFRLSAMANVTIWDEVCEAVGIQIPGKSINVDDIDADDIDDVLKKLGDD